MARYWGEIEGEGGGCVGRWRVGRFVWRHGSVVEMLRPYGGANWLMLEEMGKKESSVGYT